MEVGGGGVEAQEHSPPSHLVSLFGSSVGCTFHFLLGSSPCFRSTSVQSDDHSRRWSVDHPRHVLHSARRS